MLIEFSEDSVVMEGEIILLVTTGREPHQSTIQLIFLIVKISSAYNAILGLSRLNALKTVVSTYHLLVRFPTNDGVRQMREDQVLARQYFLIVIKMKKSIEALSIEVPDQKDKIEVNKNREKLAEQLITIPLGEDLEKTVQIGSQLKLDLKKN